jgi:hypothetical protein
MYFSTIFRIANSNQKYKNSMPEDEIMYLRKLSYLTMIFPKKNIDRIVRSLHFRF